MPKSKKDVDLEINNNEDMSKQFSENIKDRSEKETRGKSGKLSGLGETSDEKKID